MAQLKACIFDLDGVIVDTAKYHYQAWKQLANSLGFDFTEHDNEKLKGISRIRSLELILEWSGIIKTATEQQELAETKNNSYLRLINNMHPGEILPGVQNFLKALQQAEIKIALGSASKNSRFILEKIGLLPFFDVIVDGNEVKASKPNPQVFLKGAELLSLQPANCIVLEDAIAGVQAAKAGGMKVVGIGNPDVLHGADLVVSGLDQLSLNDLMLLI